MAKPPVLLFAFANDKARSLRLSDEAREIKNLLQPAKDEGSIEMDFLPNAQIEDIYNALDNFHGRVVLFHYGGHSDSDFLSLEDGHSDVRNLSEVIGQEEALKLVFLNGCANRGQVERLFQKGVNAVVATDSNVEDKTAIEFVKRFYRALAKGKTIENSFQSARSFLADRKLNVTVQPESISWRSVDAGGERGLAPRAKAEGLPWGLYHNGDPAALNWQLPKRKTKWQYWAIPALFFVLLFIGWYLLSVINRQGGMETAPEAEVPLCPPFTDSADFRLAIFPFDADNLKPERDIAQALNKLNREHRANHPGRYLFYAEAAVSARKQPYINEATIDSLLGECQAHMAIWGYTAENHSGQAFGLKLNIRSTQNVAIDESTRLAYDEADGFSFLDSLEAQSVFIFSLIDGYFNCFDQGLANAMEQRIAREDWGDTTNISRLQIASRYYISNSRPDGAIGLLNRYERLVNASPALIRNLGLSYVEKKDFKRASKTLNRMPESKLNKDFLLFRWKVHRKAGYFKPAIADINRLLNLELDESQRGELEEEKNAMEEILQQPTLNELETQMIQQFKSKQWMPAIATAESILGIDRNHMAAVEVSMESNLRLMAENKNEGAFAGEALRFASKAIQLEGEHFRAHFVQMEVPARLGQWQQACTAARKVLEIEDGTYRAYEVLVRGNLQLSNNLEACNAMKGSYEKVSATNYKKLAKICAGCCNIVD